MVILIAQLHYNITNNSENGILIIKSRVYIKFIEACKQKCYHEIYLELKDKTCILTLN